MGAGDVVVVAQGFANAYRDSLFSYIQVRQSRHQRSRIELIDLFFEQANHLHAAVHLQPLFGGDCREKLYGICGLAHRFTPHNCARTSNTTAKSSFSRPTPRAAVRTSFATAVEGMGTSSFRPSSSASSMSFCIMLTLNQASSGSLITKGPRYFTMGEAMALLVSTSTAISLEIPLFSASSTPSEKDSICTARLRFDAILRTSAWPLPPT